MDPVKYIFEKPDLIGRVTRWKMVLTKYDIQYFTKKDIKGSILSDYLVHQPMDDYQPMKFDFLDEDIMGVSDTEEGPELGV